MEDAEEYEDVIDCHLSDWDIEELEIGKIIRQTLLYITNFEIYRTNVGGSCSPFKSKIHALAFILLNSPRPIVSVAENVNTC